MRILLAVVIYLLCCANVMAWQGYNMDTGAIIDIKTDPGQIVSEGNIQYFDHQAGELKLGYLNMYKNNIGLILDLDSGDLIRVKMNQQPVSKK